MDLREQLALPRREPDFRERAPRAHCGAQRTSQRLETVLTHRGNEYCLPNEPPDAFLKAEELLLVEQIDLVEDEKLRPVADAQLLQHLFHNDALLFPRRMARVNDMQQKVRLGGLLESRAKRCHEMVRQLSNEPDGIGNQDFRLARLYLARQRVEGREQAVLYENIVAARQASQDRRLARVRRLAAAAI